MAGTARAGTTRGIDFLYPFVSPGFTQGRIPWVQLGSQGEWGATASILDGVDGSAAAARTAAGGFAAAAAASTARAGVVARTTGPELDWYEKIHAAPRTKIDFGNIITQTEKDYELYNAARDVDDTESAITNNALPGMELPSNTPPQVVPPGTSLVDPTSTDNSAGTGLGTIVLLKLRALQDGLPSFDTTIEFEFGQNDVSIAVTGTRIILLPFLYQASPRPELALEFLTDVISGVSGNEPQRISLRPNPREEWRVAYHLTGESRQRFHVLTLDWQASSFGLPVQPDVLRLTSAISSGATLIPVSGADQVDIRVGGLAAIIEDDLTYDVFEVQAVTPTQVTAASPTVNGYSAQTMLFPVRVAKMLGPVGTGRPPVNLERFRVTFEVVDNDTGAVAGSTTPGFWSLHPDGRVLLDDCNVMSSGEASSELRRRVYRIDNDTGVVSVESAWDRGRVSIPKGFTLRTRQQILDFRKLLVGLQGRQKSLWIPTFAEDLTVAADLVMGAATMDITHIGYVRHARERLPWSEVHVIFTDGTSLLRTVTSSSEISSTVERLTLDNTWPANRTTAEISRVELYELARFESDRFVVRFQRVGLASCQTSVVRVFDDD